jgi:hypothetical protein
LTIVSDDTLSRFRWERYSAVGRRMADTPFLAFKCPLSQVG